MGWGDTERGFAEERVHAEGSARADRGLTGVLWLQAQEPPSESGLPQSPQNPPCRTFVLDSDLLNCKRIHFCLFKPPSWR